MRRLNIRLIVTLLVGSIALVVGIHFVHAYQVVRNAEITRTQADKAREDGQLDQALKLYDAYAKQNPDKPDGYLEAAKVAVSIAETPGATAKERVEAYFRLSQALDRDTQNRYLREQLAKFEVALNGREGLLKAIQHYEAILRIDPNDKEVMLKLAECRISTADHIQARKSLAEIVGYDPLKKEFNPAIARAPESIEAYQFLARDLRNNKPTDDKLADRVIERMVEVNPKSAEALLARAEWNEASYRKTESPEQQKLLLDRIHADTNEAYKRAPDLLNAITAKLKWCILDGDFEAGDAIVAAALKSHKFDPLVYSAASQLAAAEKKPQDSIKFLRMGVANLPKNFGLHYYLVERLLETGDVKAARDEAAELNKLVDETGPSWESEYVDAQIDYLDKNYQSAAAILERQRIQLESRKQANADPRLIEQLRRLYNLLGRCYEATNQSDQMLEIYNRLNTLVPITETVDLNAREGIARSLMGLGRREEALNELRKIRAGMQNDDRFFAQRELWSQMLYLMSMNQAHLPKDKQDWTEVQNFFNEINKRHLLNDTQRTIWRADLLIHQGQNSQARELLDAETARLDAAVEADPKNAALKEQEETIRLAIVNLLAMQSQWPEALAALDELAKKVGDKINFRLRKADLLIRQHSKDTMREQLAKLEENVEPFSAEEKAALFTGLSTSYYEGNMRDEAIRLIKKTIETRPEDARAYSILFRYAREANDKEGIAQAANGLKKVNGTNSREWKLAEATRLMYEYASDREKNKEVLVTVRQLLREIEEHNANWPEADKLGAMVALADGNTATYFQKLELALAHGPADPNLIRQVVPEMLRQGRRDDAKKLLSRVSGEQQPIDLEKVRLEEQISDNRDKSIADAKKLIEDLPPDSENYRWLGDFLSRAGHADEAEQAYYKAVTLAPQAAEPRIGLIVHLLRMRKINAAVDEVHKMETALPPEGRARAMAHAYQLLGDTRSAAQSYEDALQEDPHNYELLSDAITFNRITNNEGKAEQLLEKSLAASPGKTENEANYRRWARIQLAQIRAPKANYQQLQPILALIHENAVNGHLSDEDNLQIARILSARPDSESRRQAISIWEDLERHQRLAGLDRLVLARLYEQVGKWPQSQSIISSIVTKNPRDADALSLYVSLLLKHNNLDGAEGWFKQLNELQPTTPRTVGLKARILAKQGKATAAKDALKTLVPSPLPAEQQPRLLEVAEVLRLLGFNSDAEGYYRDYVDLHPESSLVLAEFLGHHSDLNEALNLCERAIPAHDSNSYVRGLLASLQVAITSLRSRQAIVTPEQFERVETWIKKGLREAPDSVALQLKQAELLDLRGNEKEVEQIYRSIVALPTRETDPNNGIDPLYRAIALNNLAYMLAISDPPRGAEALSLMAGVINELGPQRDFLDTRAMCYLAQGDVAKALADLNEVLLDHNEKDIEDKSYATKYFHLALAEHANHDDKEAADALAKAKAMNWSAEDLNLRERALLLKLEADLNKAADKNVAPK
ncbi:MAG TPA: tetratricopeptide repeat protein [Pirellulales bacterium]|jgi:tetratricopeptide (TPR) repeat protein|nr:tetratricopeptide repeat protein [Pirellulales bacterium]